MDKCTENVIEFLKDQQTATVTFSQGRYKTRIRKLAKRYPEECQITVENRDGSIVAHIPVEWIRINPRKELTEEQKKQRADTMRQNWREGKL